MSRSSGVLMAVSSLPSKYGIGDIGKSAYRFADALAQMGFSLWQVLPLNCPDIYGSPYASVSAFAASPLYISPELLKEEGLLTQEELEDNQYEGSPYTADYEFAHKAKEKLLRIAYARFKDTSALDNYAKANPWAFDYGLFMALKGLNGGKPWYEWPGEQRDYSEAKKLSSKLYDSVSYYVFCQYVFDAQWKRLSRYANSKGVKTVGDMPIYVSYDSVDVWSNTAAFKLDSDTFAPKEVAAVPPDYFSEKGQLWGNPIYDWAAMEKDKFSWWNKRIERSMELYDYVRIDHFRGFASYYSVDSDAEDAIDGRWNDGPGMALFNTVDKKYLKRLIAEDLGVFGDDVKQLLDDTGLPGMRVVQFGFSGDKENTHLPHNYPKNSVAYVGTHDNSTLLGWLWEAEAGERQYLLDYCGFEGDWGQGGYYSPVCRRIIETVWRSAADMAIVAFQDLCGFGNDARMNIPGEAGSSWRFRTTEDMINGIDGDYFLKINRLFSRTDK